MATKAKPFLSPFAPVITRRANYNHVIKATLAKYLEAREANDPDAIKLRGFLSRVNKLHKLRPRSVELHYMVSGRYTTVWAYEPRYSPAMQISVVIPTSIMFTTMRKDFVN